MERPTSRSVMSNIAALTSAIRRDYLEENIEDIEGLQIGVLNFLSY